MSGAMTLCLAFGLIGQQPAVGTSGHPSEPARTAARRAPPVAITGPSGTARHASPGAVSAASHGDHRDPHHHDHQHSDRHHHHHGHHFLPFFYFGVPHDFFFESTTTVEFFGPPFGSFGFVSPSPFGFSGFGPFFGPRTLVFVEPAPVRAVEARPEPDAGPILPAGPRTATTDVPERLVEELIAPPRRPNLAQRAQSARLAGGGDRMFQAGHIGRAVERYQQALQQTPDNDEVRFKLGAALMGTGQYDRAGQVLREALRSRPDWPHVAHDLRTLFPDDDAIRRTLNNLERESRRAAADPDIAFLRGYLLYFTGDRDAAEELFRSLPPDAAGDHVRAFLQAIERRRNAP